MTSENGETILMEARKTEAMDVVIDRDWCKGCGICVELCPKHALTLDDDGKAVWEQPDNCVRCGLCELRCPDMAIELTERS